MKVIYKDKNEGKGALKGLKYQVEHYNIQDADMEYDPSITINY